MAVLLLVTVGDRDVQVIDRSRLPEEMQEVWTPARTEGEALLADLDRYRGALRYPIIGPVVRWLVEHQGVKPEDLTVVLFVTDQDPDYTPEKEWLKDTYAYGAVIRRALLDGLPELEDPARGRLLKRQVRLERITTNPANYRTVFEVLTERLGHLQGYVDPADRVYLEVTGGTPAMTSMMMVAGADAFGRQARCLYIKPGEEAPIEIGILLKFFERQARAQIVEQLDLYAYTSALATLEAHRDELTRDTTRQALMGHLLTYAERRLAFDFTRACDALEAAGRIAPPDLEPHLGHILQQLRHSDDAARLGELVHSARLKYDLGHYADFTQRLFRLQEEGFRYLATTGLGMRCKDAKGEYLDMDWLDSVPGLKEYLRDYSAPGSTRPTVVDVKDRSLNRFSLGAIARYYVEEHDPAYTPALQSLFRLNALSGLRNQGLAGHGLNGIGRPDLAQAFGEDADHIVPLLETIYGELFGRGLGESPYVVANRLIRAQMEG